MKCPRCQQDAPSDADFCPECGAKLWPSAPDAARATPRPMSSARSEVTAICEQGLAAGRDAGVTYHSSRLTSCLGYARVLSQSIGEGIALLRKGVRDHEAMEYGRNCPD
jgi:hypothetical protein